MASILSDVPNKVTLTCSLTGVLTNPAQHPVPVTPEQMAASAKDAFNAGAAVMHVHFRRQEPGLGHLPSWDPAIAKDICEAIRGFGDVDRLPHRLPARIDQDVFVYVPLEGLTWTEDEATGRHRWQIRHRIELHQLSDGLVIDPGSWSNLDHALPQPTRDTYFWIRFTVPGRDLASGRYALKVRVEEPSTGRQAERTIEIDLLPERLVSRE